MLTPCIAACTPYQETCGAVAERSMAWPSTAQCSPLYHAAPYQIQHNTHNVESYWYRVEPNKNTTCVVHISLIYCSALSTHDARCFSLGFYVIGKVNKWANKVTEGTLLKLSFCRGSSNAFRTLGSLVATPVPKVADALTTNDKQIDQNNKQP